MMIAGAENYVNYRQAQITLFACGMCASRMNLCDGNCRLFSIVVIWASMVGFGTADGGNKCAVAG